MARFSKTVEKSQNQILKILDTAQKKNNSIIKTPISICTWDFKKANFQAGMALESGKDALSSAIIGANVEEENPKNSTVGYGGAPNREGVVTLDAAVMDHQGNCGSVLGVEKIVNVSSLARDVMEKTPHVILSGKGAQSFALKNGYKLKSLLTDESKKNGLSGKKIQFITTKQMLITMTPSVFFVSTKKVISAGYAVQVV